MLSCRQPVFCDWAFNLERGEPLQKKWDLIPEDTDILITHGPPIGKQRYTVLDQQYDCQKIRDLIIKAPGVTYLEDSGCTINGIKIWGSPW